MFNISAAYKNMDDKVDVTGCLEKIFCLKNTILELEDLVAKKYADADDEDIPSVLEKCEMLIDELQKNASVFKEDFRKVFNRNNHSNNLLESTKSSNLSVERVCEKTIEYTHDDVAHDTTPDLFDTERTEEEENSLNCESINDDQDNEEEKCKDRAHKTGKKKTEKNRNSSPDSSQRPTKSTRLRAKAILEKENGDGMESSHSKDTKDEDNTEKPENGTQESKDVPTPKKNYIKVRDIKQLVSPTTETDDMSSTLQPKKKTVTFDTSVIILSSEDEGGKTKKSGKTRTEKLKDETEAIEDSSDSENEKENRKKSKTKSVRKRRSNDSDSPVEDSDDGTSKRRTKRSCAEESSRKRTKEKPSRSSNRKRVIVISDASSDEENSSEEETTVASSSKKNTSKTKKSKKSSKHPLRIKIDDLTKKVNLKIVDSNDELSLDEHDSPKSKHKSKHMSTSNRSHQSLVDWKDDVKFSSEVYVPLIRYPCENLKKYYEERREMLSIKRLANLSSLKRKRGTRDRSPSSKKSSSDSDKPQSKKRYTKKEKAKTSKVSSDSDDELMSKRKDVYIPLEPIPVEKLLPDKNFDEKEAMASLVMDKLRDKLDEADENYIKENDEEVGKEKSRKKKKNKEKEIKDSEMKGVDADSVDKKKPGDLNDQNDELSMSVDESLEEPNVNGSNAEFNDEDIGKNKQSEKDETNVEIDQTSEKENNDMTLSEGEQQEQNDEESIACNKNEKSQEKNSSEQQTDSEDKENDTDENLTSDLGDSTIENTEADYKQNCQTEEPLEDSPDKSKSKLEVRKKKTESDGKSDSDEKDNSESEDTKKMKTTSDEHRKDVEDKKSDDEEAEKSESESDVEKRKKKSDRRKSDDENESESESENIKGKKTKSDEKCKDSEDDKSESENVKKKNNSDEKSGDDKDVNSESESENTKKKKTKPDKGHKSHGGEDDSGSDSENVKEKKTKSGREHKTDEEVESESEQNDSESESGSVKNKKTKQDGSHKDDGDESESENVKKKKAKPGRDHEENEGESESESENDRKKKAKSDAEHKDGDESESSSEDVKKKANGKCKDDEKDKGSSDDHSDSDSEGTKKRDKREGEKKTKKKVDSDHESSNDQQESDADGDNKESKTKDSDSDKSSSEQKENGKSSDSDESDSDKKKKKNKNWRRDKLLTIKISSTDSEEDFSKYCKKKEKSKKKLMSDSSEDDTKKKKKKRKVKKRACVVISDSDSEGWQKSDESSSDSSSSESDKDKSKEEKNNNKKAAGRKRIKKLKESSSEEDGEKSTRKNIRRVWGKDSLAESTKKAEAEEKERKARILEKQKKYNSMFAIPQETAAKLEKLVLDFNDETEEELLKVDENLVEKLKPHQASGIQFMWDACFESIERAKKTKGSGCILAHCMGLGKTLQVVAFTHTLLCNEEKTGVKKVLVVCPVNTVLNWKAEYKKWLPDEDDFEVYELSSCRPNERQYEVKNWNNTGGVMIIGYNMFRLLTNPDNKKVNKKTRDLFQNALVDPGPDLVVCDEGHLLKNEKSHLSIAMNRIKTARRIVLTGTPLQNNLKEYFCMVQFIKPNLLGTYREYLNRFVNPITNGQYTDSTPHDIQIMRKRSHVLHKLLDGVVQRKDYSVLAPYLPQKNEYVLFLSLTDVQIKLYEHYLHNFARRSTNGGSSKNTSFLFVDFQELQGICSHPRVLVDRKIHKDNKEMFADDEESEGSLKDFIDDKEETTSTGDSSSEAEGSDKSDCEEEKPKKSTKKRLTRAAAAAAKENELIDLDSIQDERTTGWWTQYCSSDELENIHNSTKLALLFNILKESEQIGDKVLIFSQSLYSLSVIEYFLEKIDEATQDGNDVGGFTGSWALGLDYFRLDGSSSCDSRASWCNTFNDPQNTRARLFLISTRAGGLGINLVAANRVIIFDVSWNPSHDIQSIYRVYRFGQTKPCYIYRFVTYGTMEMKIYERQVTKQAISKRVIDEQQIDRHYNQNDLAELYKFEPTMEVRATPLVPKDVLLGELLQKFDKEILSYHEHQSLLENKEDEELDEEERKAAWEEFENEKVIRRTYNTGVNPGGVAMTPQAVTAALTNIVRRDNPTWNDQQIKAMLPTLVRELEQQVQSGVMTMYQRIQREIQIMNAAQEKKMREAWMQQQMMLYHQQQQQAIMNDPSLTPEQRKARMNQLLYNQWRAYNNAGMPNNVAPLMNNFSRPNTNPLEVIDLND